MMSTFIAWILSLHVGMHDSSTSAVTFVATELCGEVRLTDENAS